MAFHAGRLAITTDSFVVKPIFFPGGDIGKLAITGSVNDLAVGGALPRFISAAFILEEGVPIDDLRRIVESMRKACVECEVQLVAGDTKVVDRGKGDQVFIATTAVGEVPAGVSLSIGAARPGDRILVSGTLGDHGVAILSVREGIEFETPLLSDCAPLRGLLGSPLDPGTLREARQLAMSNGAVPSALDVARDHATKAGEALGGAERLDGEVTAGLRRLVDGLVDRDR